MRKFKPVAAVLFGIFWAVLVAEIASRVMVARGQLPNRTPADIFAAHEIGWALEPNIDVTISGGNGLVNIKTNAEGFRDLDYPKDNPEGHPRILVLGDSFTIALETPQENTFHTHLEYLLGLNSDVISLGVSGYELAQYALVYEQVGRDYHPDEVMVMLYVGNDLTGNRRWPHLPFFEANGSLVNFPYDGPFQLDLVTTQRSSFLMRQSELAFLFGTILRGGRADDAVGTLGFCGYWNGAHYPNPTQEEWALAQAIIRRLRDAVEADGAALRVAIIPSEFQVEERFLDEFLQTCELPTHAQEGRVQDRLIDLLEDEDIPYLDLMPILRAEDDLMYLPGVDIHWTRAGHAVVADALLDWYSE